MTGLFNKYQIKAHSKPPKYGQILSATRRGWAKKYRKALKIAFFSHLKTDTRNIDVIQNETPRGKPRGIRLAPPV